MLQFALLHKGYDLSSPLITDGRKGPAPDGDTDEREGRQRSEHEDPLETQEPDDSAGLYL